MRAKFYKCPICGNIILMIVDSGMNPVCCGEPMKELKASNQDMGAEKHVPVISKISEHIWKVSVGSISHPMTDDHHIVFIYLETDRGGVLVHLKPGTDPSAFFYLGEEKIIAAYEYCNLHGLWMTKL